MMKCFSLDQIESLLWCPNGYIRSKDRKEDDLEEILKECVFHLDDRRLKVISVHATHISAKWSCFKITFSNLGYKKSNDIIIMTLTKIEVYYKTYREFHFNYKIATDDVNDYTFTIKLASSSMPLDAIARSYK